ncbi:MAG: long-chain fatty acid--CoA ligase [Gammaproteobacteria bacterium]
MSQQPLLITAIMEFARVNHGEREIVSVTHDIPCHRYTYEEAFNRAAQLAHALTESGIGPGDRVGTLAWNDHRHFELYYGVSCLGGVCHTINPRLFKDQIEYIINHAEDRIIFTDPMFVPLLEELEQQLDKVEQFVVLGDAKHMPSSSLSNVTDYESFIADKPEQYDWPELDEHAACSLCYTSGTTDEPKGVLFSHRATVLHALGIALPDVMNLSQQDCVMPLVPMFHVNAWGTPYAATMTGAKLVLPGAGVSDGEFVHELMESEAVSFSLGVPTVWLTLLEYLHKAGKRANSLQRICVGGAACPRSLIESFRDRHDVYVHHGWGMTEMSPVGAYNTLKAGAEDLPAQERLALQTRQGRPFFGVEMKIVNDLGEELPRDGKSFGALKVRGSAVIHSYYKSTDPVLDDDGWFDTGDVATIDKDGFMEITDRSKDMIKSGGEWISSIALENIAMGHPDVAEAAVIGVAHHKWDERPLLIIVPAEQGCPDAGELQAWFKAKVSDWWVPDAVEFVAELPHTATGKLLKTALRETYAGYQWPEREQQSE